MERYGWLAKLFHWLIVFLVIGQFVLANIADNLPLGLRKVEVLGRHKSYGITILVLAILRLLWRYASPPPPLPAHMKGWERTAAHVSHFLLYALLFAVPLAGWTMSSARNFPVSWFGLVQLPDFVSPSESIFRAAHEAHEFLAISLAVVATLHLLAALKHHFFDKDTVLRRMLPFSKGLPVLLASAALALGSLPPPAQAAGTGAGLWQQGGTQNTLTFHFSQAGAATSGAFSQFTTTLTTGADGAPTALEVKVDVASLDTKDKDRDGILRGAELFDVKRFPAATFSSTQIRRTSTGRYEASGPLTIRDVTKQVVLPFSLTPLAGAGTPALQLAGEIRILRIDYGVGQGDWKATDTVGNPVTIRYSVKLSQ